MYKKGALNGPVCDDRRPSALFVIRSARSEAKTIDIVEIDEYDDDHKKYEQLIHVFGGYFFVHETSDKTAQYTAGDHDGKGDDLKRRDVVGQDRL